MKPLMKKYLSFVLSIVLLQTFSLSSLANENPIEKSRKALLASEIKAGIAWDSNRLAQNQATNL
jgi:hypothetical protein